jgi:hypothetical protein
MERRSSVILPMRVRRSTPSFLRVYDTIVLRISNRWGMAVPELEAGWALRGQRGSSSSRCRAGHRLLPRRRGPAAVASAGPHRSESGGPGSRRPSAGSLRSRAARGERGGSDRPSRWCRLRRLQLRAALSAWDAGGEGRGHREPHPPAAAGGVLFGSTILGEPDGHTAVGRRLLGVYNGKGVFGNAADTRDELERVLASDLTPTSRSRSTARSPSSAAPDRDEPAPRDRHGAMAGDVPDRAGRRAADVARAAWQAAAGHADRHGWLGQDEVG